MHQKKITIQDIAKTANVSKSTVSRVINNSSIVHDSKRKAVLAAMDKLNFQPNVFARGLAGGRSMTIGIVTQNIGSPFYDSVTQGILQRFADTNYSPIFADGQWQEDVELSAINTLLQRHIDGLIVVGGHLAGASLHELETKTPIIVVARELEGWENHCIFIDNCQEAAEATQFLIDAGHKKIAHITGIKDHQDAIRRYQGYKQAFSNSGLELNDQLVVEGNFSSQSGVIGVESLLLRGNAFTAIFAANDEMAFGARLALYRKGIRVPEDVSIIGFDNQPNSAYMTPPLTTVAQPAMEMGRTSADALLNLINGEDIPPHRLSGKLVIRESVARLR